MDTLSHIPIYVVNKTLCHYPFHIDIENKLIPLMCNYETPNSRCTGVPIEGDTLYNFILKIPKGISEKLDFFKITYIILCISTHHVT